MKASDIKPGEMYAIKYRFTPDQEGKIVRLIVSEIETVSHRKSDRKYSSSSSTIVGRLHPEDLPEGLTQEQRDTALEEKHLVPDNILGPYAEWTELRQKEADRKAKIAAEEKQRAEETHEVVLHLYKLAELELPEDFKKYDLPIRASYGGGIEIKRSATEALLKVFRSQQP